MHSLPCASGGEDGVCVALTQLSKELMEDHTSGLQAGGCDSSDCLFCQYRSNSPFHLNAYAGKLTTLLKKRSLSGMTLASLNSLVDTTTEQGAALLSAAAAAISSSGGKRHRTSSSNGVLVTAATANSSGPRGPSSALVAAANSAAALHSHLHSHHPSLGILDAPHDCMLMCGGRLCSEHAPPRSAADIGISAAGPHSFGHPTTASAAAAAAAATTAATTVVATVLFPAGPSAGGALGDSEAPLPNEDPAEAPGPSPSSLALLQLLQPQRRNHHHHHPNLHNPDSSHRHPPLLEGQPKAAEPQPDGQQQQHLFGAQQAQPPHGDWPPQHPHRQEPPCLVGGRPLPEGWAFRSEWQHRSDPAPAALQELFRLPGAASLSRRSERRGCAPSSAAASSQARPGGAGGGSAGIVCALEFSPDGRLLAAGGVDKQIRLYNLAGAFGDLGDEDDDEEEEGGDGDGNLSGYQFGVGAHLRRNPSGAFGGARRGSDPWARAAGRGRAGRCSDGCDISDEEDDGDERYGNLLAAVQRMPSKISSLAWSPFLDGVLTVGDYDGVLLQLHIASGHQLADVEAHGGRKIWSVAHSPLTPHLAASAADDRCARLWAGRGLAACIASVQPNPRAAVCSVDFSPTCEHLLAAACSDRTAYVYDFRSLGRGPLVALQHHSRPASYCRFFGGDRLVTAATDASLALWDISVAIPILTGVIIPPPAAAVSAAAAVMPQLPGPSLLTPFPVVQEYDTKLLAETSNGADVTPTTVAGVHSGAGGDAGAGGGDSARPCRVFRGHCNEKNFVGLSVRAADGLLACGSECSRAFAYHTSWSDPLATLEAPWGSAAAAATAAGQCRGSGGLDATAGGRGGSGAGGGGGGGGGFVSAVCWQSAEAAAVLGLPPLLASATSLGAVSVSVLAAARR